jgi:hypothetical protein
VKPSQWLPQEASVDSVEPSFEAGKVAVKDREAARWLRVGVDALHGDLTIGPMQGRPLSRGRESVDEIPIISHPNVRRMLLAQKSYVEGALALGLYCSRLIDETLSAQPIPSATTPGFCSRC